MNEWIRTSDNTDEMHENRVLKMNYKKRADAVPKYEP